MQTAVIFDLDGTLVNSSHGILTSLAAAFDTNGLKPAQPLSSELVGPPLRETLCLLCPKPNDAALEQLTISFKSHYDTTGFRKTIPFPQVEEMLQSLAKAKIPLHIATNKRHRPTIQILEALAWSDMFDKVLSPDSFYPTLSSKAAILTQLLIESNLAAEECLYIGDRFDDYNAAKEVGIPFALAEWGFEGDGRNFSPDAFILKTPNADQIMNSFTERPCS